MSIEKDDGSKCPNCGSTNYYGGLTSKRICHSCGLKTEYGQLSATDTQNDAHEKLLLVTAVELARTLHPTAYADRCKSIPDATLWSIKVDSYMDAARAMVEKMADIHEKGFREGLRRGHEGMSSAPSRNDQLHKIGLISHEQWKKNEESINKNKIVQSSTS